MANVVVLAIVVVVTLTVGAVLIVRDTVRRRGRWGINGTPLLCPNCGERAPSVRLPRNWRQALWGGGTCRRCGTEYDKWGERIADMDDAASEETRVEGEPPNWRKALWPAVDTESGAGIAIKQGYWAAIVCAVTTSIFAVFSLASLNPSALLDAALFAVIAFGLRKKSRGAAVCGLLLYGFERFYIWTTIGFTIPVVPIILTIGFINGVRGTYSWRRLQVQKSMAEL